MFSGRLIPPFARLDRLVALLDSGNESDAPGFSISPARRPSSYPQQILGTSGVVTLASSKEVN